MKSAATTLPNFPDSTYFLRSTYSGQKRTHCAMKSRPLDFFAAASMRSHVFASMAIGFSHRTFNPFARAFSAITGWSGVGSVTSTMSSGSFASISSKSAYTLTDLGRAELSAVSRLPLTVAVICARLESHTAAIFAPASFFQIP